LADTLRNLDGAARDLGFTFASSFEDAVVKGRRLSDVLQGLEQDILRILTRKVCCPRSFTAVAGLGRCRFRIAWRRPRSSPERRASPVETKAHFFHPHGMQ